MKNAIVLLLLILAGYEAYPQATIQTGVYDSYRSFGNNKPSGGEHTLVPFIRMNRIDPKYNDTLFRLRVNGQEERKAFGVFDGTSLYINTEDSLYRRMEYTGRYPFATVSNKIHLEAGYVIVNKTPIWKEERDELHTYIAFVNKQGQLVAAEFETVWALLKGDNDLSRSFSKEKYVNQTFRKYIILMNERYPL